MDFAVPELIAMLSPIRLASSSRQAPPLQKTEITPHMHPKESPLKNKANTFKRLRKHPEKNEGKLRSYHRKDDKLQPVLLLQFGDNLDAYQLRNKITGYLDNTGCSLIIHAEKVEPVKSRGSKRLAQCIYQRIRK